MSSRLLTIASPRHLLVLSLALALAACSTSGPSIAATASPTAAPSDSGSPVGSAPAVSPTPTPVSGTSACDPASLAAAITSWDGAAGHRNGTITLTNNGRGACTIHALATPQLVDVDGTILIQGTPPASSSTLTLDGYGVVNTMVSDANYCGAAPTGPVTVAFVFPAGEGRVVAAPAPGDPLGGVPPCNGAAGSPGDIDMQPFAP